MTNDVVFHPLATEDIESIEAFIAADSPVQASSFLGRLQTVCETLATLRRRGVARDDLAPGVRMLVVERRIVILYRVDETSVLILRLVYAGRNLDGLWGGDRPDAG